MEALRSSSAPQGPEHPISPVGEPPQNGRKAMAEAPYLLEVKGNEASQIREDLNAAINKAVTHAVNVGGHGILVTQHSHSFYTVALSKEVPYGQTMERRLGDTAGARLESRHSAGRPLRCHGMNSSSCCCSTQETKPRPKTNEQASYGEASSTLLPLNKASCGCSWNLANENYSTSKYTASAELTDVHLEYTPA